MKSLLADFFPPLTARLRSSYLRVLMETPRTEVVICGGNGAELVRTVLVPGEYDIGRDPDCGLCVQADLVSRRHARLTINFDHALIEDLGSDSGTFVNGQPVTEATRLWPGQKIQLGPATVTLRRQKATADDGQSLAPQTATVRQLLPEKFLRESKYDIGAVVAQGGMGAILDARETTIERKVAMKVMLDASSPDDITRFVAEARVTGHLEHPNIVPVHELSVDENDQVFYTMKLVRGITLRRVFELLAGGDDAALAKYPLPALLTIFQKVCDALAFAHSRGVIHRDLKPENIMLGDYGEALVMDWGLAKRVEVGSRNAERGTEPTARASGTSEIPLPTSDFQTLAGTIMGTPQYMAPEQARGEIEALDARSDIYALGAILYHALTLCSPVEAGSLDDILAKVCAGDIIPPIQRRPPPPPRHPAPAPAPPSGVGAPVPPAVDLHAPTVLQRAPVAAVHDRRTSSARKDGDAHRAPLPHLPGGSVPESLNAVVMKAMALAPAARYQSVADLQAEITAYQNGFATGAERAGLGRQLVLLIKRHKGAFGTAAAAWFVITALAVWFVINLRIKERRAVVGEQRAIASEGVAKAETERATEAEQAAKVSEAVALREKEATRRALAKSQLALAEAAYRDHDGGAIQAALKDVPDDLRDSNWSYLLEHADNSIATIRTTSSGDIGDVAAHPKKPGVFAVIGANGCVAFVEARTGIRLLEFHSGFGVGKIGVYSLAISPDGEKVAIGKSGEGGIVIHSAVDGSKLAEWPSGTANRLQFSPDGKQLLQVSVPAKSISLLDAENGSPIWTYQSDGAGAGMNAVLAPDGKTVLTFFNKERLRLLSAKDGSVVRTYYAGANGGEGLRISPDNGNVLIGDSRDYHGAVRCIENKENGRLLFQFQDDTLLQDLAYTADGRRIVTLSNVPGGRQSIKVWDAQTGTLLQTFMGGSGFGRTIGVHPLSNEIVVAGQVTKVWDLPPPQEKRKLIQASASLTGTFWGTDDLLLTRRTNLDLAVLDLRAADPQKQPFWEPSRQNRKFNFDAFTVSADGRYAAIANPFGAGQDYPIQFLRLNGNKVEEVNSLYTKAVPSKMRLSPDGSRLLVVAKLLDTSSGTELLGLKFTDILALNSAAWLDNGHLVTAVSFFKNRGIAGSKEQLILWDAATGKRLQTVDNPSAIFCLAALPDAPLFAEAGSDKMVRMRDVKTLEVKREFRAHDAAITSMALHPSRPILATGSDDLTVKLWDLESGRCVEELRGPVGRIGQLSISPGGKRLACWSPGITRIWEPKCFTEKPADKVDADGWENLLAQLTPASVAGADNGWRLNNGVLLSGGKSWASVALPGNFAQTSYQMRVKLRALDPKQSFAVFLPVAGKRAAFSLGAPRGNGFSTYLNTASGSDGAGPVKGQVLKDSELHELELTVRLDGDNARFEARLDEQPLYQWSGPVAELRAQLKEWGSVPAESIGLGTHRPDWVVYAVKVKRL